VIIEKHLVPLLYATEVKLAQHEGQFTDYVELEAPGIRLGATRMAFELLGALPPKDPILVEKTTVDYIVVDMPQQVWPETDGTPLNGPAPRKDLAKCLTS
jgi:hypothetical protein